VEPPVAGDETAAILGELDRLRFLLAWKCGGLDAAELRMHLGPSAITLGGLLKHMARVEDAHFARLLFDELPGPPWDDVDWAADPQWEWQSAADDSPAALMAMWEATVEKSRAVIAEALADGGLDRIGAFVTSSGESPNLRRMLLDLIEEYARHVGHADLIREAIDGLVGEDPGD
jgi:uncharacterized damage-inducible protein DinB